MRYINSVMIIRTMKNHVGGCHMISTYDYQRQNPNQFDYKGYQCKEFELYENVGGQIKVKTFDKLESSGIEYKNVISFNNVKMIEILSEHDL